MFVVLTGPDGCGKGTQTELLAKRLPNAESLHFPNYDTPTGQLILQYLKGEVQLFEEEGPLRPWTYATGNKNARSLQGLFTVNRYEMVPWILKTLASKKDLILDRYDLESIVYGVEDGLELRWCTTLQLCLPRPDLYILLDIPTEVSILRRPERRDRYEKDLGFMNRVRDRYLHLFREHAKDHETRYLIVDGDRSVSEIHEEIYSIVTEGAMQLSLPLEK